MNISIMLKLLHMLEQLRKHERWTRPQLEAYQAEALRRLREYAYAHSPFYQRFHRGLFDRPLHELPVLTKAMLMEHFDEVVTDRSVHLEAVRAFAGERLEGRLFLDRYWVTATSGSSGQPGFFLFNEPEWLTIVASFARGQEWSGAAVSLLHRRKMATVASISPWHMSSQVAATAKTWWTPSIRLPASDPLESIVQRLNEWKPDVLIAYASMARILADEQLAGRLHIQPGKTFTSSEVLTDETRRRVKLAWGDEPFNQYGATETADIAAEYKSCRHIHLFEDLVVVEVVDEHHQPVPPGTYGAKLLVTTLFSRTQPLIRYELNDSVRLATDTCPSGLPFAMLESIQGRVEDALLLPAKSGGRMAIQPLVFNRVMDILPVSGWQIVQEADDSLTVLLSGARDGLVDAALVDSLRQALTAQDVHVSSIQVQRVSAIPKTTSGKTPLIKAYRPS
ncbi:MAG: phenylacetate--CoA ligase family protein [Anaerolineales bacterium]|nr:phenylacetate--CoA ligase family protein [Anaerolineales bacterium]